MSPNLAEATKAGITAGKTSVSRLSHRQQYGTSRRRLHRRNFWEEGKPGVHAVTGKSPMYMAKHT